MTEINVRVWDYYYGDKHLGKDVLVKAKGYKIAGYDMEKYTVDEAVQEYIKTNSIEGEVEIVG